MSEQISREAAVEAAKQLRDNHGGPNGCRCSYCTVIKYILQPAPPAEAFDARAFVEKCRAFVEKCQETTCVGYYDDRPTYTVDELTAELSALVAAQGRAGDDGEAVTEEWLEAERFKRSPLGVRYSRGLVHVSMTDLILSVGSAYPLAGVATRGRVRRLLAALAIPSPTPATE